MRDLNWLLGAEGKRHFLEEAWQKAPAVLTKGHAERFVDLFSPSALERALEFSQPHPPGLRLASARAEGRAEVPYRPDGRLDLDAIRKGYAQGLTIILNSVEDVDLAVAQLARAIEAEMNARVQVNAYLTPASAQGFRAHYDTHDVLVVQVAGTKLWKVFGAEVRTPLHEMTDGGPTRDLTERTPERIQMNVGDVLYIPRGWVHEAETGEERSLHLTLGLHPPLGRDLLAAALDALVHEHSELREALPVGPLCAPGHREAVSARFAALAALFARHGNADSAAAVIDLHMLRRGRAGGEGGLFEEGDALSDINDDTLLERRPTVLCRLEDSDDRVALQFLNGAIEGPSAFAPALRFVHAQKHPFVVAKLPKLDAVQRQVLAQTLVADGLCRIAR